MRQRISPQIRMITRLFNYLTMLENGAISFKCCQNVATPADKPWVLSKASRLPIPREAQGVNCIGQIIERGIDTLLTGARVLAKSPTCTYG